MLLRRALLISSAFACFISTPALAGPVAGPRPTTVPGTMQCEGPPTVFVNGFRSARIASGGRSGGNWTILSFDQDGSSGDPVCSVPTAAEANVECRVSGAVVARERCSVAEYSKLYQQGLTTVGGGTSDIRTATWVLPGMATNGCVGAWQVQQAAVPPSCGSVTVTDTVTCVATNAQSSTSVPSEYVFCNPATRPPTERTVTDERACNITLSPGAWGDPVNSCGETTRSRSFTCTDQNGTAYKLTDSRCASQVNDLCASLSAGQSCGAQTEFSLNVNESVSLPSCTDPNERFIWFTQDWVSSGETCGTDRQTRYVTCLDSDSGQPVADSFCSNRGAKPGSTRDVIVTSGCQPTPTPEYCIVNGSEAASATSSYQSCISGLYTNSEAPLVKIIRDDSGSYTYCQGNDQIETQTCSSGSNTLMWDGQIMCNRSYPNCAPTPTPSGCYSDEKILTSEAVLQDCEEFVRPLSECPSGATTGQSGQMCWTSIVETGGYCQVWGRESNSSFCSPTPTPPPTLPTCTKPKEYEVIYTDCNNNVDTYTESCGNNEQRIRISVQGQCRNVFPSGQVSDIPQNCEACTPAEPQSCTDECGDERANGAIWTTRGGNLPRRTDGFEKSRCENGTVITFEDSNTIQPAASCN